MSHQNTIKTLIQSEAIASVLTRDSHAKKEIMALQTILHELGFGSELNMGPTAAMARVPSLR